MVVHTAAVGIVGHDSVAVGHIVVADVHTVAAAARATDLVAGNVIEHLEMARDRLHHLVVAQRNSLEAYWDVGEVDLEQSCAVLPADVVVQTPNTPHVKTAVVDQSFPTRDPFETPLLRFAA